MAKKCAKLRKKELSLQLFTRRPVPRARTAETSGPLIFSLLRHALFVREIPYQCCYKKLGIGTGLADQVKTPKKVYSIPAPCLFHPHCAQQVIVLNLLKKLVLNGANFQDHKGSVTKLNFIRIQDVVFPAHHAST